MKTTASPKKPDSRSNSSIAFFNKGAENNFFSLSPYLKTAFFTPRFIQPKLTIRQPDDNYELKANVMANKVIQTAPQHGIFSKQVSSPSSIKAINFPTHSGSNTQDIIQRSEDQCMVQDENDQCLAVNELAYSEEATDQIISDSISQTLNEFQNIQVTVNGTTTPLVTNTVNVSAQYFINTSAGQNNYATARSNYNFSGIISTLSANGERSVVLTSNNGRLSSGRAVEFGKGSPNDIQLFVQEAIDRGEVKDYAVATNQLTSQQQLTDLTDATLQPVIQDWMEHTGVGVDCSGFVLQAQYNAREALQATIEGQNTSLEAGNANYRYTMPGDLGISVRNAQSYSNETQITGPQNIRPGDAWVVSNGGHIRIVISVREVTPSPGTKAIEFVTAESSGGSTQPNPGPVRRTWRTQSLTTFYPAVRVGASGSANSGTFHRL